MSKPKRPSEVSVPTCAFELVSASQAKDWLENNNNVNRNLRRSLIEKYTRDKRAGLWLTTHQGAAFDWNDQLVDGQHSLSSIVESKVSTLMLIVRGLDPKVRMVVDIGAKRTPADVLKLIGWKEVQPWEVAIVRTMMNGSRGKGATMPEIIAAYEIHHPAARAAMAFFPTAKKKHITIAYVAGPLARAWYTQDRNRLREFAQILYSGLASRNKKGDASIILLRDYLLQLPGIGGSQMQWEIYARTETSLDAFLRGERLSELKPSKEELFPLPVEIEEKIKGGKSKDSNIRGKLKIAA